MGVLYLKILVTGSTGQLGSALLNQLKESGYKVKLTSRRKPDGMKISSGFIAIYRQVKG